MEKPIIGIVSGLSENRKYISTGRAHAEAVLASGGTPIYLPVIPDKQLIHHYIDLCQGFIFTGGPDIDPIRYGEEQKNFCGSVQPDRDEMELELAAQLLHFTNKAVLGICRGHQVLNVATGGSLYQDLASQYSSDVIAHRQKQDEEYLSHSVSVFPDTLLMKVCKKQSFRVCSLHHQAVKTPGTGMKVCACSSDGVIEGISFEKHPFYLGIQWHPERTWKTDEVSLNIFRGIVQAAIELSD